MRKSLPLLLLFVALAATAFWLWRSNSSTTFSADLVDFAVGDTSTVDRIFIAEKDGSTIDLRRTPAGWTANGMRANQFSISLLLKTFNRAEVRSPVPRTAQEFMLKNMAVIAKKVEIYQGGEAPVKIWWVGPGNQENNGTYMLLEKPGVGKSASPFLISLYGFSGVLDTRFHTRPDEWRSLTMTSYPDLTRVSRVQVDHPAADSGGFALVPQGDDLSLLDGSGTSVPMDSAAVREQLRVLSDFSFEEFERKLPRAQRDSILASKPWHVLTVTSDKGVQRIPFWRKAPLPGELNMMGEQMVHDPNRMYALLDDTALVLVQRLRGDRLVPFLPELRHR